MAVCGATACATVARLESSISRIRNIRLSFTYDKDYSMARRAKQKGRQKNHATWSRLLAENLVVLRVASNPKPEKPFWDYNSQRRIVKTRSDRPVSADFLEMQRRVGRICLEQVIARIGQLPNLPGQLAITRPEIGRREMLQISLVLPAL